MEGARHISYRMAVASKAKFKRFGHHTPWAELKHRLMHELNAVVSRNGRLYAEFDLEAARLSDYLKHKNRAEHLALGEAVSPDEYLVLIRKPAPPDLVVRPLAKPVTDMDDLLRQSAKNFFARPPRRRQEETCGVRVVKPNGIPMRELERVAQSEVDAMTEGVLFRVGDAYYKRRETANEMPAPKRVRTISFE